MFVSGFTFVRNAVKFDYPVVESILSILDLCDEFIVLVGNSDDGTRELIQSIDSKKIKIFDSVWDDSLRVGGVVLARETDKALLHISPKSDWAFYLQADEIVHEKYLPSIREAMIKYKDDLRTEGLLFKYTHFFGSYQYIADSRKWYRHEIRIIRGNQSRQSYRDAQGFRKNGEKLMVRNVDAHIYHYGWVKSPEKQQVKQKKFNKLWHNDYLVEKNIGNSDVFDYSKIDSLRLFDGSQPLVMQKRIEKQDWTFEHNTLDKKLSLKERISLIIENSLGWRLGEYKNYKIIRD